MIWKPVLWLWVGESGCFLLILQLGNSQGWALGHRYKLFYLKLTDLLTLLSNNSLWRKKVKLILLAKFFQLIPEKLGNLIFEHFHQNLNLMGNATSKQHFCTVELCLADSLCTKFNFRAKKKKYLLCILVKLLVTEISCFCLYLLCEVDIQTLIHPELF